jgi:hypothetical protein
MKKSLLAIYAAPVALLLMSGGLATPSASADERPAVTGVFSYDRNAPPEATYARLQHKAEKLCAGRGIKRSHMRKYEDACIASVIESGVKRLGRADIAAIHDRQRG